jgi:hypothetical protein
MGEAPAAPRWQWRAAQVALTLAVVVWAGMQLWRQWNDASRDDLQLNLRVGPLILATALVGLTYAMLIEVWRMVLARLGAQVAYGPAARVWFASNLGKYLPGKIWTVTAMVVMMARVGVPSATTGASVVVIAIAQAASGFAVVIFTSLPALREITGGVTGVVVATIAMALCLLAAPLIARQWNRIAVRLGREQLSVQVPLSAVGVALVGTAISWWIYGIAFQLLVMSVLGSADGSTTDYVAAYTSSYLVGLLALFAPGGLGAREVALSLVLPALGLATQAQSAVITVVSRLWLTVVELVPSVIAAVRSARGPVSS